MFNHHSIIPLGSFRGRQEEKWGSFWGRDHFGDQFEDHFRVGDHFGAGSCTDPLIFYSSRLSLLHTGLIMSCFETFAFFRQIGR